MIRPRLRLLFTFVLLSVSWPALGARCAGSGPETEQPISFSHARHIESEKLECIDCHPGARRYARAGLPSIRACHDCHKKPQSDHPDEPLVREYAARREEIPFVYVNRQVGHVYFSHRAHVTFAGMECDVCHADVRGWSELPTQPSPQLHSMGTCIACHEAEGATLDCIGCHR